MIGEGASILPTETACEEYISHLRTELCGTEKPQAIIHEGAWSTAEAQHYRRCRRQPIEFDPLDFESLGSDAYAPNFRAPHVCPRLAARRGDEDCDAPAVAVSASVALDLVQIFGPPKNLEAVETASEIRSDSAEFCTQKYRLGKIDPGPELSHG